MGTMLNMAEKHGVLDPWRFQCGNREWLFLSLHESVLAAG